MKKFNELRVSWFSPDKLEKDTILDSLIEARKYAKGKLLDVGCGSKPYRILFEDVVTEYVGLDKNTGDIRGSALCMPIKDNTYNTVLSTQVLEHVSDPQQMMNEIYRVLKKDGHAILTLPLFWCLHEEPHDYFRYTKYGLKQLAKNSNLKVVYIKDRGNWAVTMGQLISIFLEPTINRYFLKYPKRLVQTTVMFVSLQLSKLYIFQNSQAPLGYCIVLKKP
ncbi:MAG TPA: class I SAM-dependent methyltransferase [Candidatus Woesebacteria bacterium]|nr:class I SAM-dependent methyltransferase [Candidatus Woesebacteria bacterium]